MRRTVIRGAIPVRGALPINVRVHRSVRCGLHAAAHALQKKREYPDYAPVRYTPEEVRTMVETCERFVTAVKAMVGVERQ